MKKFWANFLQNLYKILESRTRKMSEEIARNTLKKFSVLREVLIKLCRNICRTALGKIGKILSKCNAIWETIHKVGKHDFKIFMASHREDEWYSEKKKLSQKLSLYHGVAFQRSKLQKASFMKRVFKVFLSWCVKNNFY